jgi:hypothetical protein
MNYKNSKIYKITDIAYTKMYIGSTTQTLSRRFNKHKESYKRWKDGKRNKVSSFDIFDEFGIDNCKIELIEEYECENRIQLERKEGEHIKNNECVNKFIAGRTLKQYYIDHKDNLKEKAKQYYIDQKEKIVERRSQKINCQCGIEYTRSNKSQHEKSKKHLNII